MNWRLALSVMLPGVALAAQWLLWPWLAPFVWFLFFPAVFFSARLGGLWGGMASTLLSTLIVWFFFIPPQLSWKLEHPANLYSVALFLIMGYLFSDSQARLRRAQDSTAKALAEARVANEKITQLYQKTLELDELKTQFFANVSHELRTPLTLIMSPLARRLAATDLSEAERREGEMMLRNARILYRQVSDLLDAAKLESGHMAVDYARIDLGVLCRAMAAQFDALAHERQIDYRIEVPTPMAAEVDGEKLQRILLNLLSNAFKFTPVGGCISLSLKVEQGEAVIAVQDNGPGVPESMRAVVFERFRQVEGGAQRRFGGTGLGLAIVKEFAELHGGSVGVAAAPGGGALFTLRLPQTAPAGAILHGLASQLDPNIAHQGVDELQAPSQAPRTAAADAGRDHAPLVLVVEDNADMNAFIAATLRPLYRVASAFDGREGLQLALSLRPDLILCDVMMPVMSGDQMVQALRQQPAMAYLPIVMLTAKADDQLRVRLLKDGVQEYLSKPFSTEELLARIGGLVSARRRTLDELKNSESALKAAQRLAGVGNWDWDVLSGEHRWSEEIYHIYGRDPALPPAVYPEVQRYFTPDSWAHLAAAVEQGMARALPYEVDAEVVRADGSHRWITARGEARRDGEGKVVSLHGTVQDITRRKRAEEEIRHLNADLERRVAERTAELTVANHELDSFAYAVSHDLRAPLRAMSGFSQALVEDYGDKLQGEARIFLDQINIASQKMSDLIEGMLVLSRATRGEMRRDPIDLSAQATALLEEMARGESERQVDWRVEPALCASGDARMIEVVLRNLLGNAWKYTGKTLAPQIHVYAQQADGRQWLCIADNGAGFNMAHTDQLFKPFRRLHRQEEFPGIGIGLATVQRIIHRHGGEIRAEASLGAGATFSFTLPAGRIEETS